MASCSSGTHTSSGEDQGFVSGDGSTVVVNPTDRTDAPALVGTTLQGDDFSLADLAGNVVVLNVWGSWCAPCRAEAPALQELSHKYAKDDVRFVGINTRDDSAKAEAFERNFEITYPSLVDPSGQLQLEFRGSLPPSAIPSTLVIDRQGRVAARVLGPTTYAQLDGLIRDVASEPSSS
jgi:thiol-disulfide isomerase/thioredoxin